MFSRLQMSENILERPDKCYSPKIIEKSLRQLQFFGPFQQNLVKVFPISAENVRQDVIGASSLAPHWP